MAYVLMKAVLKSIQIYSKMRFIFVFLTLACAALAQPELELPCGLNACQTVRCGIPKGPCENLLLDGLSDKPPTHKLVPLDRCHCCSRCVKLLHENENCLDTKIAGDVQGAQCNDGLKCDSVRHVCVKV